MKTYDEVIKMLASGGPEAMDALGDKYKPVVEEIAMHPKTGMLLSGSLIGALPTQTPDVVVGFLMGVLVGIEMEKDDRPMPMPEDS